MQNLQRAINYETVVSALGRADSFVMPVFDKIATWCNVDEPIVDNLATVSYVSNISERDLTASYKTVSESFKKLDSKVEIIGRDSEYWPQGVKDYAFLYLKGKKELLKKKGLSIVGTRLPSDQGMVLTKYAVDVIGKDYVIISGLAKGIDGIAHIQALKNEFDTIAVIGTNIAEYYPPEHKQLQDYIAEHGLLLSPFAPCRKTETYFFMNRNKVMSEIACGSLIVESADSGGGVKQAFFSEKQEKPVFIFREIYENPQLHWPHDFENPIIIDRATEIIPYLNGEKQVAKPQPDLF